MHYDKSRYLYSQVGKMNLIICIHIMDDIYSAISIMVIILSSITLYELTRFVNTHSSLADGSNG